MSDSKPLSFKIESTFPLNFILVGLVGIAGGLVLTLEGPIVIGIPVLLISAAVVTTQRGTSINTEKRFIKRFTSVLGLKVGKKESYDNIHELRIKEQKMSQTMNSRGSSTTIRYTMYNAYLITDDDSILLGGNKKKDKVVKRMTKAADNLGVPLVVE